MNERKFKKRTKQFSLRIIKFVLNLPSNQVLKVIGNQLTKSGTSIGANYRAACRAKSKSDFIYKMSIVEEEADETLYWLELIDETDITSKKDITDLMRECNEILAMTVASIKTTKSKQKSTNW